MFFPWKCHHANIGLVFDFSKRGVSLDPVTNRISIWVNSKKDIYAKDIDWSSVADPSVKFIGPFRMPNFADFRKIIVYY